MPGRSPLALAARYALAHWLLVTLIQAIDYLAYVRPLEWRLPLRWPLLQTQNIAIAALLGLVAIPFVRHRWLRWVYFLFYSVVTLYLALEQSYYKLFFDHLRPSIVEGLQSFSIPMAASSFASSIDRYAVITLALAACVLAWLVYSMLRPPEKPNRIALAAAAVLALAGIPWMFSADYLHLNDHALLTLAREFTSSDIRQAARGGSTSGPFVADPENRDDPATARRLAAILDAARARTRPLNVVFVILESVGARQILTANGLPSPTYTPTLARIASHAAIFDSIYAPYPATTRSHVSIHTGGPVITWGGVVELSHNYTGPLLVKTFTDAGWSTAMFSSARLEAEGTNLLYPWAGFESTWDPSGKVIPLADELSTWGTREEFTLTRAKDWIRQTKSQGKRFFLNYLTVASHHPYRTPESHRGPIAKPANDREKYLNTLHYTDRNLNDLLLFLDSEGLRDDTLLVITGDHGEAFGDPHALNFTHRNYLYEENVRSFAYFYHPALIGETIQSSRIAPIGSLMPSIIALAGLPDPQVPSPNLFSPVWDPQPVVFHKMVQPEQWGLRDGRWKFIQEIRGGKAQLFDLAADPYEQADLVASQSDRAARYEAYARDWFLRTNTQFTSRLSDYPQEAGKLAQEQIIQGLKPELQVGVFQRGTSGPFQPRAELKPDELPAFWMRLPAAWEEAQLRIAPPKASSFSRNIQIKRDMRDALTYFRWPGAMPEGTWNVELWAAGERKLTATFAVRGTLVPASTR